MNAEYINPFVEGTQSTLNSVCGESPTLGNVFTKTHPYSIDAVSITVGIMGQIKGNVVFTMKSDVACFIASKMMFGMPLLELDDMSKSAVSEVGNMISGNVATLFSVKGILVDITPPSCQIDATPENFPFLKPDFEAVCIPFQFQDSKVFEIDIFLED